MSLQLNYIRSIVFLVLFTSYSAFAEGKRVDVAKVGNIGNTTYKCVVLPDGRKAIVFSNSKGKETDLNEAQSNKKLKREANKTNRKKRQVKENTSNKAKRKKKLAALNEKKKDIKEARSSSKKCFSGELPLERSDPSGVYTISIPMEVIPPGTELGDFALEMVSLDDLTIVPEPREVFQVQPDGLTLMAPGGTFKFPIGPAEGNPDSEGVLPIKLPDSADTAESDDILQVQSADISEPDRKSSKTDEEIKNDRKEAEFAFSEFARYVFGDVSSGDENNLQGSFTHTFNLPESAFLGESFDFQGTLMRFIGRQLSITRSPETGAVISEIVATSGTFSGNMSLDVNKWLKPSGRIQLGSMETEGDALEFVQALACEKVGIGIIDLTYKLVVKAKNTVTGAVVSPDTNYLNKGTLMVICKLKPKPCKPTVTQEITAPNPGEKKSEFFGVQFDSSKSPTGDVKLENPKTAGDKLVPGSTSETTKVVPFSELPDDLKPVFKPGQGKQVVVTQLDVEGGDGKKHEIEYTAFCDVPAE